MGFPREIHMIKDLERKLQEWLEEVLSNLDSVSQESFVSQIEVERKIECGHRLSDPGHHEITTQIKPILVDAVAAELSRQLIAWNTTYGRAVEPVRRQFTAIDESLERLDRMWRWIAGDLEGTAGGKQEEFRRKHREQFDYLMHLSRVETARMCLDLLFAATKAPSTMAALTKSYSWRDQVRRAAASARVVLHPEAQQWIDAELLAEKDAEAHLKPIEEGWRRSFDDIVAEMNRLSEILAVKHKVWQTKGRIQLASDLYEKHLHLLKRPPPEEKILFSSWQKLARDWQDDELGPWWTAEEVTIYTRGETALVSWSEVQRMVLMRQWEVLTS